MIEWAKRELDRYFGNSDGEYATMMKEDVLEVLKVLEKQGHSGTSAMRVIYLIDRLWNWKPLTPLTGEDDEWNEPGPDIFQNKRCSAVFKKKKDGKAYWIDGIVFVEPDGHSSFTCSESKVDIEFPFTVPSESKRYKLKYNSEEVPVAEQLKNGTYEIL